LTNEFDDIKPPLTDEHVRRLTPALNRIAASFAPNVNDRDDYVQQALLKLASSASWPNPLVVALSAFKNYYRDRSAAGRFVPADFSADAEGSVPVARDGEPLDALIVESMQRFEGLGLTKKERRIARLYYIDKFTQTEITERLGVSMRVVVDALKRVVDRASERWLERGDPDEVV
jgi:DNA-directed RNA polymerase specialized sigma24 family protein